MPLSESLKQQLLEGAQSLGYALDNEQLLKLEQYLDLLNQWNKVYNLTAIRTLEKQITHHILDSLSAMTFVSGSNIADVGSGAGLPGLIWAIMKPDWPIVLFDKNIKKTRFLQTATYTLGLKNVQVKHVRVESFHELEQSYDTIVCRAFASSSDFLQQTQHLGGVNTNWLLMKGIISKDELNSIEAPFYVENCQEIRVPGLEGEHRSVILVSMRESAN